MTTREKADELATLHASLDVERAQNKTLHAELDSRRARQLKLAGILELVAERLRDRGRSDDALLAFVLAPIAEVLRDEERQAFGEWLRREAATQPERVALPGAELAGALVEVQKRRSGEHSAVQLPPLALKEDRDQLARVTKIAAGYEKQIVEQAAKDRAQCQRCGFVDCACLGSGPSPTRKGEPSKP